jgi:transposase
MWWNFHKISPEIKSTILKQIKEDLRPVLEVATEFKVSTKTIYNWLKSEVIGSGKSDMFYISQIQKLKREKEDILKIVWALSVVVERLKKKDEEDYHRQMSTWRK